MPVPVRSARGWPVCRTREMSERYWYSSCGCELEVVVGWPVGLVEETETVGEGPLQA